MFNVSRQLARHLSLYQHHEKCLQNFRSSFSVQSVKTFMTLNALVAVSKSSLEQVDDSTIPYVGGAIRFLRSMKIAVVISLDYTFSSMGLTEDTSNYGVMMSRIHQRSANRLLEGCLKNGGTYIKLGQGLVCMNHILPPEYVKTLQQLQDKCLKRRSDEVKDLFLKDFGKTPEEMYKHFNNEAIAAASLAQVFKATTKEGKEVAVKVQYIDLRSRFRSDVATIEFLLNIIGSVHKDFNFAWIFNDLKRALKQELDFILEGRNAECCAKDLALFKFIYVPQIYWELSSTRVLVTEFIDGLKINDVHQLKKKGFSLSDIDTKMFQVFGYQIFQTGFVHADPHPGNVLIRRHKGQTQLVLLDHGLYETITENDRIALSHVWKAIVLNDKENLKKYSGILGVEDYERFAEILTQMPLKRHNFKLISHLTEDDLKHIQKVARERFNLVMSVLRSMPSSLLLILRNLNTIRAIALEHGNPIDRYEVLARTATKRSFEIKQNICGRILGLPTRILFEINLLTNKLNMWFQRTFLKLLYFFGRAPDIGIIIEKMS